LRIPAQAPYKPPVLAHNRYELHQPLDLIVVDRQRSVMDKHIQCFAMVAYVFETPPSLLAVSTLLATGLRGMLTATEIAPLAEKIRLAQAMSDQATLTRARSELNRWTYWISRRRATCEAKKRELASLIARP
jgi:hypothetical protein